MQPSTIAFHETSERAGALLESGAAFARLQGQLPAPAAHAQPVDVVVIGAGQAGLSVGFHLARAGLGFVILDAHRRVGDSWRKRWDSLRLFTPARYDSLVGMPFPAPAGHFPTKDEMAEYLEAYAERFALPVRCGVRVDEVWRSGERYLVRAGAQDYLARHVVVAAASYQEPKLPAFASALDPSIRQWHSSQYRNASQLNAGTALLVGAGNSGAEIALDLARTHRVWLAGRHPGHLPVAYDGALARHVVVPIVFRVLFHRVLTADNALGRKARPKFVGHSGPLIRVRPRQLAAAGVQRVARLADVRDGQPVLEDGRRLSVDNVVWCTGYRPGLDWLKLPALGTDSRPDQYRGVATREPGLYFVGLPFQHSPSSAMIHGVARDARRVAERIVQRMRMSV